MAAPIVAALKIVSAYVAKNGTQAAIKKFGKDRVKQAKNQSEVLGYKMVGEVEEIDESFDKLVDKLMDDGKSEEDAKKIAGAVNRDYVGSYKDE